MAFKKSSEGLKYSTKNPKPLPYLKKIGKRYNLKKVNIMKKTDKILNKNSLQRIISRKSREKENHKLKKSTHHESMSETKHLISNRSSNYMELNKAVMK